MKPLFNAYWSLVSQLMSEGGRSSMPELEEYSTCWEPPLDIFEIEEGLIVRIDAGGIDPTGVQVEFEEGSLRISGQRKDVYMKRRYLRMEIHYGYFCRRVSLPQDFVAELAHYQVSYENGILLISIPRKAA